MKKINLFSCVIINNISYDIYAEKNSKHFAHYFSANPFIDLIQDLQFRLQVKNFSFPLSLFTHFEKKIDDLRKINVQKMVEVHTNDGTLDVKLICTQFCLCLKSRENYFVNKNICSL